MFFGQSSDSTIYHIYKTKKNVTGVKYVKDYYANGQLKSEGWMVLEKSSPESEIIQVSNWANYDTIEHRFGVWKSYYKDGKISEIDSIGKYKNELVKEYFYNGTTFNGKNCLLRIATFKPLVSIDKVSKKWYASKQDDIEWIHFQYFSSKCNIIAKEEYFIGNNIKSGTWKWYKKGSLTKTQEYKDGKLIAEKKYGT